MVRPFVFAFLFVTASAMPVFADAFVVRPYVQNVGKTGATVFWETAQAGPGVVAYGETPACLKEVRAGNKATVHKVRLSDLTPGSTCHYRVAVGEETLAGSFRTAPEAGGPVTFVIVGGSASWPTDLWERSGMADHAAQWEPDLYLHMGNMVNDGRDLKQWRQHFERFATALDGAWMAPVRGTGEGKRELSLETISTRERPKDMQAFMREAAKQRAERKARQDKVDGFSLYQELPGQDQARAAFDWGDTHFVLIAHDSAIGSGAWLEKHLAGVNAANVVVAQHLSIYTAGQRSVNDLGFKEGPEAMSGLRTALESKGVLLDLAGQAKVYDRTLPLYQGNRDDRRGVIYLNLGGANPGGFPEWFTASGGLRADAPIYTVVHLAEKSGWLRTFAWDKASAAVVLCDYRRFWHDEAIPATMLAKLKAAKGQVLLDTIEDLGAAGYDPAVDTLLPLLDVEDVAVRRAAARALRRIGNIPVSVELLPHLGDPDLETRRELARALEIAMDQEISHAVGEMACDNGRDPQVRDALLGALASHAPFYFAFDTAMRILEAPGTPSALRDRAAWVMDRVATRDDVDALLALALREQETYPLLRIGHALNRLCETDTSLAGKGELATSAQGVERDPFVKTWTAGLAERTLRETQQEKREAFERSQRRWRPTTTLSRSPMGVTE